MPHDDLIIIREPTYEIVVAETDNSVVVSTVGAQGPVGPQGAAGGSSYTHTQSVPSTLWTVSHGLNKQAVTVAVYIDDIESTHTTIITKIDDNTLTIDVGLVPLAGKADVS